MGWLERAGRTPGKGLHVGIALWLEHGFKRSDEVRLSLSATGERFGFHRSAASRGLRNLEAEGLVQVLRRNGSVAVVKLIYEPVSVRRPVGQPYLQTGSSRSALANDGVGARSRKSSP
jgi:hypothetical protein